MPFSQHVLRPVATAPIINLHRTSRRPANLFLGRSILYTLLRINDSAGFAYAWQGALCGQSRYRSSAGQMARAKTPQQRGESSSRRGRKSTQRERLIAAMMLVANRDGYARASVSAVIGEAGVSRPTFYEYFSDRDACFLAALEELQDELLAAVSEAVASEPSERAAESALTAVLAFASSQPTRARFLLMEPLGAGPRALDARDRGIEQIAALIDDAHARAPARAKTPDLPSALLVGGAYRLLASRLRRGEPGAAALLPDVLQWLSGYARPPRQHAWAQLSELPAPAPSPYLAEDPPLRAPLPLPPGRPRLSPEEVLKTHRQAILFAAGALAASKGYAATTIADITKLAGVDARAFYRSFNDKYDAFMAIHELGFQQTMAITAGAFFTAPTWPERSWEAGRAITQFLQKNPTVAHVGFVEAYCVGPGAVQRVEDSYTAFTIFLQEGYQHAPSETPLSRVALEAIITTIFELVYVESRSSRRPQIASLLAHMTFVWLAPFIGPQKASEFIQLKLGGAGA
jgi:AcrR family transcriptional regulator